MEGLKVKMREQRGTHLSLPPKILGPYDTDTPDSILLWTLTPYDPYPVLTDVLNGGVWF